MYDRSGGVDIAYQVLGDGPHDVVLVPGWVSNIEMFWESPRISKCLKRLASFTRLILFDKRGTGLSDRSSKIPDLETRMDDVRAVMDAVGSDRAALCGYSEGGSMCCLFSATFPERVSALVMMGSFAKRTWSPDYPWGPKKELFLKFIAEIEQNWGGPVRMEQIIPSQLHDPAERDWWARFLRMSASPAAAAMVNYMNAEIDIRHVLPAIQVPTLILHSAGDQVISIDHGRYLAQQIPNAKFVELPGADHDPWGTDSKAILDEIIEFTTGTRPQVEVDRVLATMLFTDIVGSTEKAAELGDRTWRNLLEQHNAIVRRELAQFRGREIDNAGDGFLATFDGPARAIRCARAIGTHMKPLGIKIRAGLHTGECEVMGEDIGGIAVHIAARVSGLAEPDEVLVSSTVKDLVAGSGIEFEQMGSRTLKGVPGEWHLFRVASV